MFIRKTGYVARTNDSQTFPPFHPNCKCRIIGFYTGNPNDDPMLSEIIFWVDIIIYGDLSIGEQAQALISFYSIANSSAESIMRALTATEDIKNVDKRIEAFFDLLDNASNFIGTEMGLPEEDVDYSTFRWEDYKGLTAYNPGEMQEIAYTDSDGFRRIDVEGLDEPAYMAALGSCYLKDENGVVNPNGVVFRVYLSNGNVFYVVAGDMKSDADTNPDSHQYTYNLSYGVDKSNADVIEFIIDQENMDQSLWGNNFTGEPSYFQGEIIKIEKLDMTVLAN